MSDFHQRLHNAIQSEHNDMVGNATPLDPELELPPEALLTGWVLVCEWVGSDGEPYMTSTNASGQPIWKTAGLAYGVLQSTGDHFRGAR